MKLKCTRCGRKASGRTKKDLREAGVKIRLNYPFGKKSQARKTYICLRCNSTMQIIKKGDED